MSDELQNLMEMDIVAVLGLEHAPANVQQRVLGEANDRILREVIKRIQTRISPEVKEEFERLFSTQDDHITDADMEFLKKNVPDFADIMIEETLKFKKGVVLVVDALKQKEAEEAQKINGILNRLKD